MKSSLVAVLQKAAKQEQFSGAAAKIGRERHSKIVQIQRIAESQVSQGGSSVPGSTGSLGRAVIFLISLYLYIVTKNNKRKPYHFLHVKVLQTFQGAALKVPLDLVQFMHFFLQKTPTPR